MMEFCVLLLFVFALVVSFCFMIKETRKWGAARRNSNTKWEEMVQNPKHHIVQPGTGSARNWEGRGVLGEYGLKESNPKLILQV